MARVDLYEIQSGHGGFQGALARAGLSALSCAYGCAVLARGAAFRLALVRARELAVPVVSVGNLTAGGTGKTPFVAWLCSRAKAAGRRPGILARGYGPKPAGSPLSDEGTLLSEILGPDVPQVEDPDRLRGGARLLAEHPEVDLVLLDDGFQHRRLARDLDVVLLDATEPFGFGRLLPRGRLRERKSALARAEVVVLNRIERADALALATLRAEVAGLAPNALVAAARTVPRALVSIGGGERPIESLRGLPVLAYAAIGNPGQFEATLAALGARVVGRRFPPDHHRPTEVEAAAVAEEAKALAAAAVVTTRKDLVKWRSLASPPPSLVALDASIEVVENERPLLERALRLRRPSRSSPTGGLPNKSGRFVPGTILPPGVYLTEVGESFQEPLSH